MGSHGHGHDDTMVIVHEIPVQILVYIYIKLLVIVNQVDFLILHSVIQNTGRIIIPLSRSNSVNRSL